MARSPPVRLTVVLALLTVAGCSGAPARPPAAPAEAADPALSTPAPWPEASPIAGQAVARARGLLGTPYRLGGADPAGFDCSGLVRFVFQQSGIELPRTAAAQQAAVTPIDRDGLIPGDLVFFRLPQPHVGIYSGGDEFIHAPGSGRGVEVARLGEPWFQLAFAGAGRVTPPAAAGGGAH